MPDAVADVIGRSLSQLWSDPDVRVDTAEPFGDGHSGFTYLIELMSRRYCGQFVARLSAPGARRIGPADLARQGQIMSVLHEAGLPVPRILAADSTGLAAGRALLVMDRVDGISWAEQAARFGDRLVAENAVQFLHTVRGITPEAFGLDDEAPEPLSSDVQRWLALLPHCPSWLRSPGEALGRDLLASTPSGMRPSLVHGDYHYGNLLFRERDLAAVLDWEIASIGDPRLDFGCLAVASLRARYQPDPNPTGSLDVSFDELCDIYQLAAPVAVWFVAAACLKYAAILGYNLGLHNRGKRPDPIYERLLTTIAGLAADGALLLRDGWSALRPSSAPDQA